MTSQLKVAGSIVTAIVFSLVFSCRQTNKEPKQKPIARVFDKYLYPADLKNVIPSNISASDSGVLANDYIDKWIRKQLLLRKAELNLTEEEKNVDEQIEDYKTSLLVFKYEQSLIKQKLDTIIRSDEIENYYNENSSNFLLSNNIVKALFLQVPRDAPELWNVRRWCRSNASDDLRKLEAYAYQHAKKYDYFNDDWVDFKEIEKAIPYRLDNVERYLKYRKNLEFKDSTYYYMISLKDYRITGDIAPLEYVTADIEAIIMNKRRIQMINRLESNIYNDALNRRYFTIY